MGCCFSEPDADDSPANNHSQMPLDHHSSQASCSPQKLNQPDNAEALRLQGTLIAMQEMITSSESSSLRR